jgi:uncharacterized protein YwqG
MINNKKEKLISFILNSTDEISTSDKEKLVRLIRPTIGIKTKSIDDIKIEVGKSKIGGKPDLPQGFVWPKIDNKPLLFCAQYNLSEIQAFDSENMLPNKGMFYIFLNINDKWGEFSVLEQDHQFIYTEHEQLFRTDFPDDYRTNGDFQSATIKYFQFFTLPDDENYRLKVFNEKNKDFYFHFYQPFEEFMEDELFPESISLNQILGYDRSIQSSVVYDFASKELNLYTKDVDEYRKQWNEILELSKSYELLLQLDCDDCNTNLNKFGGSGTFYFGIKQSDLNVKSFKNVCMSFQMT